MNGHRQNTPDDTEKSIERHAYAHQNKVDSSRLSV